VKFICTFTGVDSYTINNNLTELLQLSRKYPFIEWGVLFSMTRAGQDLKYPAARDICKFTQALYSAAYAESGFHVRRSLHLCGSAARKFLTLESAKDSMLIHDLVGQFDRIQLNINAKEQTFEIKPTILRQLAIFFRPIIIQYNNNNKELIEEFGVEKYMDIHILKDASGGNGIVNSDVSIPDVCKYSQIGFAGGMGPENIETIFPNIYESVMANNIDGDFENSGFWIDMETRVRNAAGHFDLEKVNKVAEFLSSYLKDKSVEF